MSLMSSPTRRDFLSRAATAAAMALSATPSPSQSAGERPQQDSTVEVINPRARVPVSLIIDDSTCLVNLNRFAVPQFAAAWNSDRYGHDWRSWPHEIPDDFVRKFGDWCGENRVKGKYSIVPFPACVGRVDRLLPGWSKADLDASLKLVRDRIMPDWDIHPEMVTHTRVIDIKTGHPYPERGLEYMENWRWTDGRSADQIADYMRYALQILHNVDLPCEGITTPGGFGQQVLPELARASLESCRDVFRAEIPHYFRHVIREGQESVAPRVEYASGLDATDPHCVVSIIACTGDWTVGWDCSSRGRLDDFISENLNQGRMVDVIEQGEPAIMLCHWTGIYFHGEEVGFKIFQEVVRRLHAKYDHLIWMKLREISRYWAAKELTSIESEAGALTMKAPFACPGFTLRVAGPAGGPPVLNHGARQKRLKQVANPKALEAATWTKDSRGVIACFDLPKGKSTLDLASA